MNSRQITLYHAARSRSSGAVALLEALGADYRMQVLDLRRAPTWLRPTWPSTRWARCRRSSTTVRW